MRKVITGLFLSTAAAMAMVGCASNSSSDAGAVEQTAANAGRVVDDSVITAKVKSALIADPVTKAHQINVETNQGTVQLSGFVDSAEARSQATSVARTVDGVKNVKNDLELRSTG